MALQIDRSLRLPDGEFLRGPLSKNGLALHHTVGGTARSTYDWWLSDPGPVGTAYLIERDGTIHEVFGPEHWAWQFGLPWSTTRKAHFEQRFIGIELASEGGLLERDGQLYCFDRVSERTKKRREDALDFGANYRGYRFFDTYEPRQIDSLVNLINHLCDQFGIPRRRPDDPLQFHGEALLSFEGVIGHAMVRADKSDPAPDASLWTRLERDCGIVATSPPPPPPSARRLTDREIDELFEHNVLQIDRMNVSAGSMVKAVIMELQRLGRATYIKLRNARAGGHVVQYQLVQGDGRLVMRVARALGFKEATESRLEVRGA